MDNPYQPPSADLIKRENGVSSLANFKKFSTWYVFGLSIITLGIYLAYWLYSRTNILNKLPSVDPIGNEFIYTALALYILSYPLGIGEIYMGTNNQYMIFSQVISLIGSIFFIIWAFKFRNRLNIYLTTNTSSGKHLGPVLTFFFQVLYLSYKLNENIEIVEESNHVNPADRKNRSLS